MMMKSPPTTTATENFDIKPMFSSRIAIVSQKQRIHLLTLGALPLPLKQHKRRDKTDLSIIVGLHEDGNRWLRAVSCFLPFTIRC